MEEEEPRGDHFSPVQQKNDSQLFSLFRIAASLTEYLQLDMKNAVLCASRVRLSQPEFYNSITVFKVNIWSL